MQDKPLSLRNIIFQNLLWDVQQDPEGVGRRLVNLTSDQEPREGNVGDDADAIEEKGETELPAPKSEDQYIYRKIRTRY